MMFNAVAGMPIPRAQTFGTAKAGMSPLGTGCVNIGLGNVPAQRSSSFSAYPNAAAGVRRVSPVRPAQVPVKAQVQSLPSLQQAQAAPLPQATPARAPPRQHGLNQAGHHANLEVSQRMARANELQQRLAGKPSGAAPGQLPPGVNLDTPNLLNWAKERVSRGVVGRPTVPHEGPREMQEECFEMPYGDTDPLGLGLHTLQNLPPPPRSAPAAAEAASAYGGISGLDAGEVGNGSQFHLTVLTSDSRWEALTFSARDNLELRGATFLQAKGLKAAFKAGLVSKMQSMISFGQTTSSVDIVDLI